MTRRVCVVTGTRAEFGLLRPVMQAIGSHRSLELSVVVTGAHLLPPTETWREVERVFPIAGRVVMQQPDEAGRHADAIALGRGVQGMSDMFGEYCPDCVVVLGDRIEAFAAASAASVGGIALAHIHGGDRAEGVADEAMRHAITKLAHLHLAATRQSAERIVRMGEPSDRVVVTGSPAIDGLDAMEAMTPDAARQLFGLVPETVILLHPCGLDADEERAWAESVIKAAAGTRALVLAPNRDPGCEIVRGVLEDACVSHGLAWGEHLEREKFIGLLKLMSRTGGVLVGNSSAGLIECAAVGVGVVNVGPRQNGRERAANVVDVERPDASDIAGAMGRARGSDLSGRGHPYGNGDAGVRIAGVIAGADIGSVGFLRKRNTY